MRLIYSLVPRLHYPMLSAPYNTSLHLCAKQTKHNVARELVSNRDQGFIQDFSVGVGKTMRVELRGLGVCKVFLKFTYSEVASGGPKRLAISY